VRSYRLLISGRTRRFAAALLVSVGTTTGALFAQAQNSAGRYDRGETARPGIPGNVARRAAPAQWSKTARGGERSCRCSAADSRARLKAAVRSAGGGGLPIAPARHKLDVHLTLKTDDGAVILAYNGVGRTTDAGASFGAPLLDAIRATAGSRSCRRLASVSESGRRDVRHLRAQIRPP
jgi:hypothetical protein